jgi:acetyl esterase/lipase
MYYHTNQDKTTRDNAGNTKKIAPIHFPDWMINIMGTAYYRLKFANHFEDAGTFVNLFGGHPNQCPELYELFSPITHVNAQCPATIQILGAHDVMVPVDSVRSLHSKLVAEKVKSVLHIIPQTDHAFDLILPVMSPSAQAAINDVERFLALQCNLTE